ncbi:MAG TPA: cupin domain-containing protein [Actinophytocola sp.]|jgi:quercetin dioxygenase-like cupin family protein|nr:cupin domain-containing protein [Actinophytocola sp.]
MTSHPAVTKLDETATQVLDEARRQHARRAARTLVTGTSLRVTLIALTEGAELAEHDAPVAATLQAVSGRVQVHTHDQKWFLDPGELLTIPHQRHGVTAVTDAVVLLTVALR